MQNRWSIAVLLCAGCLPTMPEEVPTQQVSSLPFTEPRPAQPTRVSYAPATQEASFRVLLMKDKLLAANPQLALQPYAVAIASPDPEIFHVGTKYLYITEPLVRQCQTDGQLAAVLANEMGRMVSEREAKVSDEVRQPDRPLPIHLPIGSNGNAREADPLNHIELALYEKLYRKHPGKLPPPNPQFVAREVLERAGFQRTDLDAALPILQNAERFRVLQDQFNGTVKQSDWKTQ